MEKTLNVSIKRSDFTVLSNGKSLFDFLVDYFHLDMEKSNNESFVNITITDVYVVK